MKRMRLYGVTALAVAALLLFAASASACTGVYVGKEVSQNGAALLARSVDLHPRAAAFRVLVVDRVENEPGRVHRGKQGFAWPLPSTTYQYTSTPMTTGMNLGRYGSACLNERGLAVTATVTAYTRSEIQAMDPSVPNGLCEEVLAELVAASCATAREGVALIGKIMAELGSSEQNIIMIADQREAWYIETYTGHQWAALRMPEDKVAVFGNQFMIRYLDPASEDALCSEGLFTLPEETGLAVYGAEGKMDIFRTYAGRLANYANRRTWIGHTLLAPGTAGPYERDRQYELFYTPEGKVSTGDVMELLRNRFEGTPYAPDETGRVDQRVIGTETQGSAHILEVHDDLPAAMACVGWVCLANSEHSVYLPISNLITGTAAAYQMDSPALGYDPALASLAFKRLCALAEQDRVYYGAGVRAYWHGMEEKLLAQYPETLAKALELYAASPEEAADYLTRYTIGRQEDALSDANAMFDELMWYVMDNTDTLRYDFSYDTLIMEDTPSQLPFATKLPPR